MVSAAAFTVPESGYVVSACVFLMQVPAPACAPLCVPGLSLQSIIHYHYFNPFNTLQRAVPGAILRLRAHRGARAVPRRICLYEIAGQNSQKLAPYYIKLQS